MNAKKMLALLLALAMVLSMAACGGSQQADTPPARSRLLSFPTPFCLSHLQKKAQPMWKTH